MFITLRDVSVTYDGAAQPVFRNISATFPQGWTALLGDNGIGKTTLAALAAHTLEPDAGTASGSRLRAAWIEQDTMRAPSNLDEFAMDWSPTMIRTRDRLGIGDDWPYRWNTLSGGERKKLQAACALALEPDILVADEPTNHLDMPTRDALIDVLREFPGIGIVITHDIAVIDRLASRSYLLHRVHDDTGNHTVMDLHEGSWEDIERQVDERDMTAQRQLAQAKSETKRLVAERVQRREKTRRAAAASMRVPDRHDHDASKRKKFAKGGLDAGVSRNVARLEGRIAAARQAQEGFVTETKRRGGVVNFTVEPSKRHELMHLEPGTISFENGAYSGDTDDREAAYGAKMEGEHIRIGENGGKSAMLAIPGISVGPRDHILVTGPNGSGKTTLVNALMNTLDPDIPRLVIEQNADDPQHLLDQLAQLDGTDRQEALGYFVAQNGNVHAVLEGGELSPGECRKLMLALGLVQKPQILILDEPTNHLDLSSKRALAAMLYAYPGALVLVTHDELMIEAIR